MFCYPEAMASDTNPSQKSPVKRVYLCVQRRGMLPVALLSSPDFQPPLENDFRPPSSCSRWPAAALHPRIFVGPSCTPHLALRSTPRHLLAAPALSSPFGLASRVDLSPLPCTQSWTIYSPLTGPVLSNSISHAYVSGMSILIENVSGLLT